MILKTYSRVFTSDLDATLALLEPLVGRKPELRVPFRDMEVLTLGEFCILSGPAASLQPFLGAVGPVIVDDLVATEAAIQAAGAQILSPITEVMTGQNLFSKDSSGVVIEYVQWTPAIWHQIRTAPISSINPQRSGGNLLLPSPPPPRKCVP